MTSPMSDASSPVLEVEDLAIALPGGGDRLRAVVTLPAIVAPRPDQRGPIFGRERRNRPHHVDEIFELPGRTAPHVLVPVRKLRWRARMR